MPFVVAPPCLIDCVQAKQHGGEVLSKMVVQLTRNTPPFTLLRRNHAVEQFRPPVKCPLQVVGQLSEPFLAVTQRSYYLRQFLGTSAQIFVRGAKRAGYQIGLMNAGMWGCDLSTVPESSGYPGEIRDGTGNPSADIDGENEHQRQRSAPGYEKDKQRASNRTEKNVSGNVDGHCPSRKIYRTGGLVRRAKKAP
jgi:hypothetical protein